jgi:hypothetical protein
MGQIIEICLTKALCLRTLELSKRLMQILEIFPTVYTPAGETSACAVSSPRQFFI